MKATRKAGFLIEDASRMGRSIEVLRDLARKTHEPALRGIADWLDGIPVGTYFKPLSSPEEIQEVA